MDKEKLRNLLAKGGIVLVVVLSVLSILNLLGVDMRDFWWIVIGIASLIVLILVGLLKVFEII